MSELPESVRLLQRVGNRLRLRSFARRLYISFLILCGVYGVILLCSRLLGLLPANFEPLTLLTIPIGALICGMLFHRRPSQVEAAHAVDQHSHTKDLYLTLALLETTEGEYKPLVMRDAETRATTIRPVEVVPFTWGRRAAYAAGALVILLVGIRLVPQLDPFGKVEAAELQQDRIKELQNSKKATELRAAQLKKSSGDNEDAEESDEVKKALEELKQSFRKMKPLEKQANFKTLAASQKELGNKWRKISAEKLRELLNQTVDAQRFGAADPAKMQKWTRELQEGSTKSLQKELESIKQELEKLAKEPDPVKRAEMMREIKKKMKDLEDFAAEKVNSKPLSASLQRAMKQLETSKFEGMSEKSLEAAAKSLDLTKMELKEIAQSAKDLKALEEALKTLQMAKQANDQEKLDGAACEDCVSLSDYAELFAELGGDPGDTGEGLGEQGTGNGTKVDEDDSAETGFKSEQSKAAVQAGKVLLSLKTKGLSDTGEATKEYREMVRDVRQGVSEAILQEKIPPGYHKGIQGYFDSIDKNDSGTNNETEE